jgi:hemoglobin
MDTQQSLYERIGGDTGLARLLKHFYSDVRQHSLLAPVFNREIKDWPEHLKTIASFWARITGGPSDYSGRMPAKHLYLGINASHFEAWLQLWRFNCGAHLSPNEAREMISLAQEIGARLKGILASASVFSRPL